MSLLVYVLSIFLLLDKTSSQPKPRSVSSSIIPNFNVDIHYYSPNTHKYFISTDVTFYENSSMFLITHPPSSDIISLPLLYPVQDTSPVHLATPPRPLQVYTCRKRTDTWPPADSSPMAPSSTNLVLPSPTNLSIAIRKGTHSSRNPHPIYNFLIYHRLSSPYSSFVSTLSSIYVSKTVHEALSHSD